MTIEIIQGDLLDAFDRGDVNVIGHCCNAQGVMGSGIAKSIKERYPEAFNQYKRYYDTGHSVFGYCIPVLVDVNKGVFNLVGQDKYGYDGKRYLNYGALGASFDLMARQAKKERDVIGFPYLMGCDRAGGDWEIVLEMIEYYFKHFEVKIYKLEK